MKIAAKIALGYGVLIALILAALSYQVSWVHQMQSVNKNLSGINFRGAIICLQLLRDLDQVEEFTRKFFVTGGDPGYASRVEEMRDAFTRGLEEVRLLRLSAKENEEIARLLRLWVQFLQASSRQEQAFRSRSPQRLEAELANQSALFDALRIQTQSLIRATRLAIQSQAEESARAGQRAERISWAAATATLVVSLLVSFWVVRSISRPLHYLTEGTRAVAQGKFSYRLDETGKDELAQLARDFNSMTRRLNELDEMKKDFVSHVSHELKSPLASMQETIRLLLDQIPGPLTEQQRRLMELSLQSGNRLFSLIGNLLDLSRMEAGVTEYEIRAHDLAALVRTVLGEFEVQVREKGLCLEAQLPEQPVLVECDGDRIIQVIGNLLGNALKFSPPGGTIRVRLSHVAEMPGNVPEAWRDKLSGPAHGARFALVSISDSGPGIPAAEKEKIFEKFHQLKQTKKIAGKGAGLGLAIGRTIVEAHRGAIWVEDNPGGGSVFCVALGAGAVTRQAASRVSAPI